MCFSGTPFGGAKAGIIGDPAKVDRVAWMRAFAKEIKPHEIGDKKACTGKPVELGGIPHELGTTGYGIAIALDTALKLMTKFNLIDMDPKEVKIVIQRFGNVGTYTAKFLDELGYKIVAINDISACIYDRNGLNIPKNNERTQKIKKNSKYS